MESVAFKVGDRVKCLDSEGCSDRIAFGAVYTVSRISEDGDGFIWLKELGKRNLGAGWMPERFELVSEAQPSQPPPSALVLPTDPKERKGIPIMTGVLDYFPAAIAEVAKVSVAGNEQHNPGQPLHHSRGKSMDHSDAGVRHWMQRGSFDTDGLRHMAKAAWRALADLEEEMEKAGAPLARGARLP